MLCTFRCWLESLQSINKYLQNQGKQFHLYIEIKYIVTVAETRMFIPEIRPGCSIAAYWKSNIHRKKNVLRKMKLSFLTSNGEISSRLATFDKNYIKSSSHRYMVKK